MKAGDIIYCWDYPPYITNRLTLWKGYKIEEIITNYLYILDDKGNRDLYAFSEKNSKNIKYMYKYFMTQQEFRKLKLDKINGIKF